MTCDPTHARRLHDMFVVLRQRCQELGLDDAAILADAAAEACADAAAGGRRELIYQAPKSQKNGGGCSPR